LSRINVRGVWDRAVDALLELDLPELDALGDQIIEDIGSECDAYRTSPLSGGPPERDHRFRHNSCGGRA
jgi:hypothetical protein